MPRLPAAFNLPVALPGFDPEILPIAGPPGLFLPGYLLMESLKRVFCGTGVSLDFFEVFTIYFCFRSAKPLPTRGRAGKRKTGIRMGVILDETFCFQMGNHDVAVMVAASINSGIRYDSVGSLIGAALLLGILNAFCVQSCSCSWRR